jgi:hypothetical protein
MALGMDSVVQCHVFRFGHVHAIYPRCIIILVNASKCALSLEWKMFLYIQYITRSNSVPEFFNVDLPHVQYFQPLFDSAPGFGSSRSHNSSFVVGNGIEDAAFSTLSSLSGRSCFTEAVFTHGVVILDFWSSADSVSWRVLNSSKDTFPSLIRLGEPTLNPSPIGAVAEFGVTATAAVLVEDVLDSSMHSILSFKEFS